ncbi:MAG: hypothetical protein ACQES9_08215 [Myxococcota bacterium]
MENTLEENNLPNFEVLSFAQQAIPEKAFNPSNKEILVLLSGKVNIEVDNGFDLPIPQNKPVIIEKPYKLKAGNKKENNRLLRISFNKNKENILSIASVFSKTKKTGKLFEI